MLLKALVAIAGMKKVKIMFVDVFMKKQVKWSILIL